MDFNNLTKTVRNTDFDFWLGTWDIVQQVRQTDGSLREYPAQTVVTTDLDGHVLLEHWTGETCLPWEQMTAPELRKALSIRSYDPLRDEWNIHWIDNRNRRFIPTFTGNFRNERGDFYAQFGAEKARISFTDIRADSVRWSFSVEQDGNWTEQWIMYMTRKKV